MKSTTFLILLSFLIQSSIYAQLSGDYTVCSGGSCDFATLTDASNQLASDGISGPVRLLLADTLYSEQITFSYIDGSSEANTITIEPIDTLSRGYSNIAYDASGIPDNFVVTLDSARFIDFRNVWFTALNATYGNCITMTNGCSNILIDSSRFLSQSTSSSNVIYIDDRYGSHISITNSMVKFGGIGLASLGFTGYLTNNVSITNTTFYNNSYYGIHASKADSVYINNNTFISDNTTGAYTGIYFNNVYTYQVNANRFDLTSGSGLELNYSGSDNLAFVSNNIISLTGHMNSTFDRGISIENGNRQNIYFNTVVIGNSSADNSCVIRFPDAPGTGAFNSILNNNLVNLSDGRVISVEDADPLIIDSMNYNNLYTSGDTLAFYHTDYYTTLSAWQTATNFDMNSLSEDPLFGPSDFYYNCELPLNDAGTPLMVHDDFSQNERDPDHPDIGAYENIEPMVDLGEDTVWICQGEHTTISADYSDLYQYSWSNGSHENEIEVSTAGLYTVVITVNACSVSDSVFVIVEDCNPPNTLNNESGSKVTLYPSPFNDNLNIDKSFEGVLNISIIDMQGREIYHSVLKDHQMSIPSDEWQSGIYLVKLYNTEFNAIFKVLKQ